MLALTTCEHSLNSPGGAAAPVRIQGMHVRGSIGGFVASSTTSRPKIVRRMPGWGEQAIIGRISGVDLSVYPIRTKILQKSTAFYRHA